MEAWKLVMYQKDQSVKVFRDPSKVHSNKWAPAVRSDEFLGVGWEYGGMSVWGVSTMCECHI